MRFLIIAACTVAAVRSGAAAQGPPSTDIFLAPLSIENGRVAIGAPVNITTRAGYDNQPSFTPNSRSILYTSVRDDAQSDIYRYDLDTKQTTRVTSTPESEYSATVMPGGGRFSVIRVEKDSVQRLWSFAVDGSDPRLVIASLKPVGYHLWIDGNTLAMFVLGQPNALVIGDLRMGRMDTVARGIGRSLAMVPDGFGFSYTQTVDSVQMLRTMARGANHMTSDLVKLPRGTQDIAWLPGGALLAGSGSKLVFWYPGAAGWTEVADVASSGASDVTRIAVSPDGRWVALVVIPRSGA